MGDIIYDGRSRLYFDMDYERRKAGMVDATTYCEGESAHDAHEHDGEMSECSTRDCCNGDYDDECVHDYGPRWPGECASPSVSLVNSTGDCSLDEFISDCLRTMSSKGHDYQQGTRDILHNFRTVADAVGVPMEKAWFTYFYKHYSALVTYIKEGGQSESEPIRGRIKDMIVYLLLFTKVVEEMDGRSGS